MSDIDYRILRSVTARDLVRALLRDGFELRRKRGSHDRYAHEDGWRVTVPYTRRGDTFAIGTLHSIIERQDRWTFDDLKRLELLP